MDRASTAQPAWWTNNALDLERLRDGLGTLMQQFWEVEFAPVWQEIAEGLAIDSQMRSTELPKDNMSTWWSELSPRMRVGKGTIHVLVPWKETVTVTPSTDLVLIPSVFCWPHIWLEARDNALIFTYQTDDVRRWAEPVAMPDEFERSLGVLSDPTRLQILRHLFAAMGTTGSISHALRLSPSTISRHLGLLHSVGLVERVSVGHYALFRVNQDMLVEIARTLANFNRTPVPPFLGWDVPLTRH